MGKASVQATPERTVRIDERLLGSNAEGYAVLRKEVDNGGRYYSERTRVFLDEYRKVGGEGDLMERPRKLRSRQLVDFTTTRDPELPSGEALAKQTKTVNEKDDTVSLATILEEYPGTARRWDTEQVAKFTVSQEEIRLDRVSVLFNIAADVFGGRYSDIEWKLDEVLEDGNALYLRLWKGGSDEVSESLLVGLSPRQTRQIRAHLFRQPVYLVAATAKSLEEAQLQAAALVQRSVAASKWDRFYPEIWSAGNVNTALCYLVVDSLSGEHVVSNRFQKLKAQLGVELSPWSSEDFQEKFEFVEESSPAEGKND